MSTSTGHLWRRPALHPLLPPIAALAIGIVLSGVAWFLADRHWDIPAEQAELNALGESRRGQIQEGLNNIAQAVDSLEDYFTAADHEITRDEFDTLVKGVTPGVLDWGQISWAPRVGHGMRPSYEDDASNQGLAGYRILARRPDASPAVAPDQDEYFPILYSAGSADIPAIVGLDLSSDPALREAMTEARDNNRLVATPLSELRIGTLTLPSIEVVLPVYKHGSPQATMEERRRNLAGFFSGTFAPGLVIERIMRNAVVARGITSSFIRPALRKPTGRFTSTNRGCARRRRSRCRKQDWGRGCIGPAS